jgi:hypothetical protein
MFYMSFISESEIGITAYYLPLHHATKACMGCAGKAPHILNLDIRRLMAFCKCSVHFRIYKIKPVVSEGSEVFLLQNELHSVSE